jgi:hypothetical protein
MPKTATVDPGARSGTAGISMAQWMSLKSPDIENTD